MQTANHNKIQQPSTTAKKGGFEFCAYSQLIKWFTFIASQLTYRSRCNVAKDVSFIERGFLKVKIRRGEKDIFFYGYRK
jgi:hypothetical protein